MTRKCGQMFDICSGKLILLLGTYQKSAFVLSLINTQFVHKIEVCDLVLLIFIFFLGTKKSLNVLN